MMFGQGHFKVRSARLGAAPTSDIAPAGRRALISGRGRRSAVVDKKGAYAPSASPRRRSASASAS